jgi:hypothetical protein
MTCSCKNVRNILLYEKIKNKIYIYIMSLKNIWKIGESQRSRYFLGGFFFFLVVVKSD